MKVAGDSVRRQIACFLVMLLAAPAGVAAASLPQQALPDRQPESVPALQVQSKDPEVQPSRAAGDATQAQETYPDSPGSVSSQSTDKAAQSPPPKVSTEQPQMGGSQPVGTAVAPYQKITGIAATRPTGAVIAPAKQRRAHSILIRVSLVVGAAVAVGTVVALSTASHSRP